MLAKRPYRKTLKLVVDKKDNDNNTNKEETKQQQTSTLNEHKGTNEQREMLKGQLLAMKEKQVEGIKIYFQEMILPQHQSIKVFE